MWIQCNNVKMQLRAQRIVWPSVVGSIICLSSYLILIEILISIYGLSFKIIAVANTVSYFIEFGFFMIVLLCGVGEPKARRCIRGSDLRHWGEYFKIAIPCLLLEIIEGWNF